MVHTTKVVMPKFNCHVFSIAWEVKFFLRLFPIPYVNRHASTCLLAKMASTTPETHTEGHVAATQEPIHIVIERPSLVVRKTRNTRI